MRKVNSAAASKAFKRYMAETDNKPLAKAEFVEFMIGLMRKYDFCDTKAEEDDMRGGFDDVFQLFDYDKSGALDSEEVANCLALMCGGSINEKIFAAFKLFDTNNSMTLSFDELNRFIKCVFQIFAQVKDGCEHGNSIWKGIDVKKLTLATTEKCFADNKLVKGKGEVNYIKFMNWMMGRSIISPEELQAIEASEKPTKKSDFSARQFKNTKDFVQGFIQECEFVDLVKEVQQDSMLGGVRLFVVMDEFKQYRKGNQITNA